MNPRFAYQLLSACLFWLIALPIGSASAGAQEETAPKGSQPSRAGIHEITVRFGVAGDLGTRSRVLTSGVSTGTSGLLAVAQYDYWVEDEWAIGVSAGVIDSDASFSIGNSSASSSAAAVAMVSLGVTYRPAVLSPTPFVRPFVSLGAGPYFGSFTGYRARNRYWGAHTSTVFGARGLVGFDFRFKDRIKMGVAGGYHAVGSFDEAISPSADYSRPEFSIAIGMGFGG
jgi:hypothetical protein